MPTLYLPLFWFALLCAMLATAPAAGHDEHDWMRQQGIKDPRTGEHCCSPNRDCQPIKADDLTLTPDGWRIHATGEVIPERQTLKSQDGRFWRCERNPGLWPVYPRTRCLFVPPGTS